MICPTAKHDWPATALTGVLLLALTACSTELKVSSNEKPVASETSSPAKKLAATTFDSGFADAHDTYNGVSAASDGNIYYALSSDKIDVAAQMYCYDPKTDKIRHLGD